LGGGVGHVHGWAEMRLPVNVYVGDGRGGEEVAVGPRARRVVMRLPVDNVYVGDGQGKGGGGCVGRRAGTAVVVAACPVAHVGWQQVGGRRGGDGDCCLSVLVGVTGGNGTVGR